MSVLLSNSARSNTQPSTIVQMSMLRALSAVIGIFELYRKEVLPKYKAA